MYVAELRVLPHEQGEPDTILDAVDSLVAAYRMNGQVLGREHPIAQVDGGLRGTLMLPERDALDARHDNKYVERFRKRVAEAGGGEPAIEVLGLDPSSADPCECEHPSSYVLYTNFLSMESPLRCGDCFDPVPLYRVPPTYDDEYYDVLCWAGDYAACDHLQMGCQTGERFALREMGRYDSSLSQRGQEICRKIEGSTGVPVYYYLHRWSGRSLRAERARRCPACGGEWILQEPLHRLFDFRCEGCRLLSKIAGAVASRTV